MRPDCKPVTTVLFYADESSSALPTIFVCPNLVERIHTRPCEDVETSNTESTARVTAEAAAETCTTRRELNHSLVHSSSGKRIIPYSFKKYLLLDNVCEATHMLN